MPLAPHSAVAYSSHMYGNQWDSHLFLVGLNLASDLFLEVYELAVCFLLVFMRHLVLAHVLNDLAQVYTVGNS